MPSDPETVSGAAMLIRMPIDRHIEIGTPIEIGIPGMPEAVESNIAAIGRGGILASVPWDVIGEISAIRCTEINIPEYHIHEVIGRANIIVPAKIGDLIDPISGPDDDNFAPQTEDSFGTSPTATSAECSIWSINGTW